LTYKYKAWKNEKEIRLLKRDLKSQESKVGPIVSVIAGLRTIEDGETYEELRKICNEKKYDFVETTMETNQKIVSHATARKGSN